MNDRASSAGALHPHLCAAWQTGTCVGVSVPPKHEKDMGILNVFNYSRNRQEDNGVERGKALINQEMEGIICIIYFVLLFLTSNLM